MNDEPKSSDAGIPGLLSALLDGEATRTETDAACAAWRDDAQLRDRWHAYALIGDVLRCEDLARTGERDAAFVRALGVRLASEPTPMNPGPLKRMWRQVAVPAAVAAGFAAVAGTAVVLRGPAEPDTALVANGSERPVMTTPNGAQVRQTVLYVDAHRVQSIRRGALAQAFVDQPR